MGVPMPWRVGSTVSEARRSFLADYASGVPLDALLSAYDIKKSAAYELLKRAREMSMDDATAVKSRAPHRRPSALNDDVVERIIELKRKFPKWGPKKLVGLYAERFHERPPSTGSINHVLRARGLTRINRRHIPRPVEPLLTRPTQPNDVWATDHKGKMKAFGVEPLTVIDLHSRYWLECRPFTDKSYKDTRAAFEKLFDDVGAPLVIRVDGGQPWRAVTAPHRLTQLSAWWIAVGIRVEAVSCPQHNGCIERLHGTMERDMNESASDVRLHFEEHRRLYNEVRPHEALHMVTPSSMYRKSPRRAIERVFDPSVIGCDESRPVQANGRISWKGEELMISQALVGRRVGLRRRSLRLWSVHYFELELGSITGAGFVPGYPGFPACP